MTKVRFITTAEQLLSVLSKAMDVLTRYGIIRPEPDNVFDVVWIMMDLDACNSNGCPLDFDRLAKFSDEEFADDILGIVQNMDRTTGQLMNLYRPRCARSNRTSAKLDAAGSN